MSNLTAFYLCNLLICGSIISTATVAKADELPFDDSFYLSTICTSLMTHEDNEYCDDGYILKSETLKDGNVIETVLMEGMGGYGWSHTGIDKIDANTYHVYFGCGSPCGANMLFGRGDKEQHFGLYFNFDAKSRCTVEYNQDKNLWIARQFFTDKKITLPSTYGISESAFMPKYNVEFDKKGNLVVTDFMGSNDTRHLPNPCTAH